jgi:hypothetical protein
MECQRESCSGPEKAPPHRRPQLGAAIVPVSDVSEVSSCDVSSL